MYERTHNWREVIKGIDPELEKRITGYTGYALATDSEIPRKYKELILTAVSAALRYGSSIRTHGSEAMYYGATDKEVIEALSLASLSAGFTAFIEGIEALGDRLTVDSKKP
jgi:alkylhydroperoxidase/carboxymuconolactone decarboxylase family protein YurZ